MSVLYEKEQALDILSIHLTVLEQKYARSNSPCALKTKYNGSPTMETSL